MSLPYSSDTLKGYVAVEGENISKAVSSLQSVFVNFVLQDQKGIYKQR